MPPGLKRHLHLTISLLAGVMFIFIICWVRSQKPFLPSMCEFDQIKSFEGVVIEKPYPLLAVKRPYANGDRYTLYYLVGEGKHGAQDLVRGLDKENIALRGSLIYLDGQNMIEVIKGSIKVQAGHASVPLYLEDLGETTAVGEIVDSKCYLGAMNPGDSHIHRSCAIRCISGGIPPLFVIHNREGRRVYMLLEGADGRSVNKEVLDWIAQPVEITGKLSRYGNLLILKYFRIVSVY